MSRSAIAAVLTVALMVWAAAAQQPSTDCASKLVPCGQYLNSTKPSEECCTAMKTVITNELSCLCGLIKNPGALAGINLTQALELPKYCNLPSDTSACNAIAQSPGSSSLPPPATPGGNGGNGAGSISWMGMPALLLASAFAFFY